MINLSSVPSFSTLPMLGNSSLNAGLGTDQNELLRRLMQQVMGMTGNGGGGGFAPGATGFGGGTGSVGGLGSLSGGGNLGGFLGAGSPATSSLGRASSPSVGSFAGSPSIGSASVSTGATRSVSPSLAANDVALARSIESQLAGSPLAGKNLGAAFVDAGRKHNVDPVALAAISKHETNFGKLGVGVSKHMGVGAFDASPNKARQWDGAVNQIYSGAKTFDNLRAKAGVPETAPLKDQLAGVNKAGWATDQKWAGKVENHYNALVDKIDAVAATAPAATKDAQAATKDAATTPEACETATKDAENQDAENKDAATTENACSAPSTDGQADAEGTSGSTDADASSDSRDGGDTGSAGTGSSGDSTGGSTGADSAGGAGSAGGSDSSGGASGSSGGGDSGGSSGGNGGGGSGSEK